MSDRLDLAGQPVVFRPRCPTHDLPFEDGKCPMRRCVWEIETLNDAPRVTREMVDGESLRLMTDVGLLLVCGLCGAAVPHQPGDEAFLERHRAWHDRLERLLETRP